MKKADMQPVCDAVFLKSLEGFTVNKVVEERGDTVMELVNHQTGVVVKLYIDRVLYGFEMMKIQETTM